MYMCIYIRVKMVSVSPFIESVAEKQFANLPITSIHRHNDLLSICRRQKMLSFASMLHICTAFRILCLELAYSLLVPM